MNMSATNHANDISRWMDEGGAGPDLDGVPPARDTTSRARRRTAIFACSALVLVAVALLAYGW